MEEIPGEFKEAIENALYGEIINCKPRTNLKEILELTSFNKLGEIYNNFTNTKYYGKGKNIDKKLYALLTNKESITNFYKLLITEDTNYINKIIENNGVLEIEKDELLLWQHLLNNGIIYSFKHIGKYYLVIPSEIIEIIKIIKNDMISQIKENDKIYDLIISLTNLYGIISIEDFIKLYTDYYTNYFPEEGMNIFKLKRNNGLTINKINNRIYFIKEMLLFGYEESLSVFINLDNNKVIRKPISLEKLLKYTKDLYYEKDENTENFINYLVSKGIEKPRAENIVGLTINNLKGVKYKFLYYLSKELSYDGLNITEENYEEIMYYISKINDNVISWGNKGYTNKEILLGEYEEQTNEIPNPENITIENIKVCKM